MKKRKIMALLLAGTMVTSMFGSIPVSAAETSDYEYADQEIELLVDMHGWMPTVNTEATAENPTVFLSPQIIADKFQEMYPNITIKWARTKPVGGLQAELAEWFTTQINAGTCPAIAFSWGTQYQDRDWYLPLDEYLETPNEYVEGNEKWSDLFPDYLWENTTIADANGNVVAVPIALYAGPATGYFYNKDAFNELGLEVPTTWEELLSVTESLKEAGYTGIAPVSFLNTISFATWVQQFSLGPYMAAGIMEETDYDQNGQVTTTEQLRAAKEGLYNPVDKPYAQELFKQLKRYYTDVLETGWDTTDYTGSWNTGEVGIKEDGLWNLSTEAGNMERTCDYGVFAVPPLSSDTTEYAAEASYTEAGPYQPDPDLQLNIMEEGETYGGEKAYGMLPRFWFNWGQWRYSPAFPNLASEELKTFVKEQLTEGVLTPLNECLERLEKEGKEYLFAGMSMGWETHIPDYSEDNPLLIVEKENLPIAFRTSDQMQEWEAGAYGYAALTSLGYDQEKLEEEAEQMGLSAEEWRKQLLYGVIHDYSEFLCKTAWEAGIPREKLFTHMVSNASYSGQENPFTPPIWCAVNDYSIPGFTMSPVTCKYDISVIKEEIQKADPDMEYWGNVEGYAAGVNEEADAWEYFQEMFGQGALVVSAFGYGDPPTQYFTFERTEDFGYTKAARRWLEEGL